MVAEGAVVLPGAEIVEVLFPGAIVNVVVEDGSPVITTSLAFSESVGLIVAVSVRFASSYSHVFFTGMFVLVYVALRAKEVSVEVPPANLLTIFVFELQAAIDHARRTKIISITE